MTRKKIHAYAHTQCSCLKKNPRLAKLADVMGHRGQLWTECKEQRSRTESVADLIQGQQTVTSSVDRKYVFSEKPRQLG